MKLIISLALLCVALPQSVWAQIDLIVDDDEELQELFEDGVRSAPQNDPALGSGVKRQDSDANIRHLLLFSEKADLNDTGEHETISAGRDPVFDEASNLQAMLDDVWVSDDGVREDDNVSDQAVKDIILAAESVKEEPPLAPDVLNGFAVVAFEDYIKDQDVLKLYYEQRSLFDKPVQIIGFEDRIADVVRDHDGVFDPYLGQVITLELIDEVVLSLKERFRVSNIPFTNVYAPPQDVKNGVVFIVARPANVEDIRIAESQYFNERRILSSISQELGEPMDVAELEKDLAILSLHPDRQVKASFSPGASQNTTLIDLDVEEQKPWRVYAARSNDGSEDLDKTQHVLGGYHNNLWGMDHRASYQYTASADNESLKAHNFSYTVPYFRNHSMVFDYVSSETEASVLDGAFSSTGEFEQFSFKHQTEFLGRVVPFEGWGLSSQKLAFVIEDKKIEGDILFTLFGEPLDTGIGADVRVFNTAVEYSGALSDPFSGVTDIDGRFVFSPGGVGVDNDDENFITAREDVDADYAYLNLELHRQQPLSVSFNDESLSLKHGLIGQYSAKRLIGSERFINSHRPGFRGYKSGSLSGDSGVAGYVEVSSAPYNFIDKPYYRDGLSAAVFSDFGTFYNRDAVSTEDPRNSFLSLGGSLKYQINDNVNSQIIFAQDVSGQSNENTQSLVYRLLFTY